MNLMIDFGTKEVFGTKKVGLPNQYSYYRDKLTLVAFLGPMFVMWRLPGCDESLVDTFDSGERPKGWRDSKIVGTETTNWAKWSPQKTSNLFLKINMFEMWEHSNLCAR